MSHRTSSAMVVAVAIAGVLATYTAVGATSTPPPDPTECADEFDQTLVDAATAEGSVVFYTAAHTDEQAALLAEGFSERFGIDAEYTRNSSSDVINLIDAELTSGELNADVVGVGSAAALAAWDDEGMLAPVDLPNSNSLAPGIWEQGGTIVPGHLAAYGVLYNTDNTPEPPTSWAELVAAGNIGMPDPEVSSGVVAFLYAVDTIMGEGFVEDLGGAVTMLTDAGTALPQLVMTGEIDFSTPTVPQFLAGLVAQGEPAGMVFMEEGTPVVPTALAAFAEAEHPNAAQLLLQYAVSCDFQTQMTATGSISVIAGLAIPQLEGASELLAEDLVPIDDSAAAAMRDELIERFQSGR